MPKLMLLKSSIIQYKKIKHRIHYCIYLLNLWLCTEIDYLFCFFVSNQQVYENYYWSC